VTDNIAQIDFTSVGVSIPASPTLTITGSLDVDYTTQSVTGTLTGSVFGTTGSISSFTVAGTGTGPFTITSAVYSLTIPLVGTVNVQFSFSYNGQEPNIITSAELISTSPPLTVPLTVSPNVLTSTIVCFAKGTLIRTPRGDVAVETLAAGDVVLTASGEMRSVEWTGYRVINCRNHVNRAAVLPVRISADAFGPNRPSQDLYLSSGHSVCVDLVGEVFIPAGHLINGATIARIEVDEVSYWHVELDSHDVLLANNLPAESYMAMGNRSFFGERRGLLPAIDEGGERTHADFCRPVVLDGPVLAFARERLLTRAEALGWTASSETDLHLVVDGEVRRPLSEGDAAVFLFPAGAHDVRLKSNTFIPALLGGGDPRSLGVSLTGLVFLGGHGDVRPVDLDDERLQDGLHPGEAQSGVAWRWTNGELALSPAFWQGLSGCVVLHVTSVSAPTRSWIAPVKAPAEVRPLRGAQAQLHVA
jgi:Hint domain